MSNEEKRFYVLYQPGEPRGEYNVENRTVRVMDSAPQGLAPELTFDIDEVTQQAEQDALFGMRNGKIDQSVYDQIYAQAEYRGGPKTLRQAVAEVLFHAGEAVSLGPNEHDIFINKEQVQALCGLDASADPIRLKRVINQAIDRAFANGSHRSANQRFRAAAEAASLAARVKVSGDEMIETFADDLRNIYHTREADRLPSVLLAVDLALQGETWSRYHKDDQPITAYQLGELLGRVGVKSNVHRVRKSKDRWMLALPQLTPGAEYRGFKRSQLEDLFKRCEGVPRRVLVYQPVRL